ncbi:MAG: ATP-dependent Clp protease adaptor ClpS [Armatimonadetes bacterium]|nr:ATP-dependent Clp protease adaptor ClpS [Armatimonadota bacterium]
MDLTRPNWLPEEYAVTAGPQVIERPQEDLQEDVSVHHGWIVRVYNNEHNTYDEVMNILMVATHCDTDEAYLETWEIDHLGSSVVHHGEEQECRRAAGIIGTIGIRVEVLEE